MKSPSSIQNKSNFTLRGVVLLLCCLFFPALPLQAQLYPVKVDQKWGLIDKNGSLRVTPDFDAIRSIEGDHAVVVREGRFGLINSEGASLIETQYKFLEELGGGLVKVSQERDCPDEADCGPPQWGLTHLDSKNETETRFDLITEPNQGVYLVNVGGTCGYTDCEGGLWGIVDSNALVLAEPQFRRILFNSNSEVYVRNDTAWGLMDLQGNMIIPPVYDSLIRLKPGLIAMKVEGLYGILNDSGQEIVAAQYENIGYAGENYVKYFRNFRWGLMDERGKELSEPQFSDVYALKYGWFGFREKGKKWGIFRLPDRRIFRDVLQKIDSVTPTSAIVQRDFLVGAIDTNGREIIPIKYNEMRNLGDSLFLARIGKYYRWFDPGGRLTAKAYYDMIGPFNGPVAKVLHGGKWGLINIRGQLVIPPRYEDMRIFQTAAKVKLNNDWKYIYLDEQGNRTKVRKMVIMKEGDKEPFNPLIRSRPGGNPAVSVGWFFSMGKQLWGLKMAGTTQVLINPTYKKVGLVQGSNLTVVIGEVENQPSDRQALVNHTTGEQITDLIFNNIKANELAANGIGRATYGVSGKYCLLNQNGEDFSFDEANYIGVFREGYAVVNVGGATYWSPEPRWDSLESRRTFNSAEGRWIREYLYSNGGLWGLVDLEGQWVLDAKYEALGRFSEGFCPFKNKGKWGLLNESFVEVIPPRYDFVEKLAEINGEQYFIAGFDKPLYGFLNDQGETVILPRFEETGEFHEGQVKVKSKGKWGFANLSGEWSIPAQFKEAGDFQEGRARVRDDRYWGFISKEGAPVTPQQYLRANDFSDGLAKVQQGKFFGFIDREGNFSIPAEFADLKDFSEGLAAAQRKGNYGLIDLKGRWVIQPKYYRIQEFQDSIAIIQQMGDFGLIDCRGEFILKPTYKEIGNFSEDLAKVRLSNNFGYIRKDGTIKIPLTFANAGDFSEGLAAVMQSGKWGFIDTTGTWVVPPRYSRVAGFQEGRAAVELNGKWGFIDVKGRMAVQNVYDDVRSFNDGRAAVMIWEEGWGFINENGSPVVECLYQEVSDYKNGIAQIQQNSKWGLINNFGAPVTLIKYDKIGDYSEGLAKMLLIRKIGVISQSGKEILPPEYDNVKAFGMLIQMEKSDRIGYVNANGNVVWQPSK